MTTVHKNLTGSDLHEPKGADTATAGKVYVSDGAGSGVWTTASDIITNTAFTTGDAKLTHKVTADTSWIMWSDGTIGDASSGATIRANADTSALFTLYWNNYSNALCAVSGGRGANAAADYAAHKTLALPLGAGRVLGLAGSGSGLTARTVGSTTGAETVTLAANQIPTITSSNTGSIGLTVNSGVSDIVRGANAAASTGPLTAGGLSTAVTSTGTLAIGAVAVTSNNTGSTAVSLMQPTAFMNVMIKL